MSTLTHPTHASHRASNRTRSATATALHWRDWAASGGVHGLLVAAATWGMAQGWTPPPAHTPLDLPMHWVAPTTAPVPPTVSPPPPRPPVQQAQPTPRPRPQALSTPSAPSAPTPQPTPPAPRAEVAPSTPLVSASVATESSEQKMASSLSNKAQKATNSEATEAPRPATAAAPKVDWRGLLNTWLVKHKTYPLSARRMRQEGTVVVQAAFAADGSLLECNVADSSGFAALDAAALQLVRAAAHAALASAAPGDRMTLRIPIVYELKDT